MKILAGDIGGTNTRLAVLHSRPDGGFDELDRRTLPSSEFDSLEEALCSYRRDFAADCEVASLGVAGPVFKRRCQATNLPWVIDADDLEMRLGLRRVELLNDLEAQAYGIAALDQKQLLTLHAGEPQPGNAAMIAAGTGLGQAGLYFDGHRLTPFATEGGHADFAPRDEREFSLLLFLKQRFGGRVSWERVLSGPGLVNLFDFVVEVESCEPQDDLRQRMELGDPAAEISKAAMAGTCLAAEAALDLFVELLGSESANLALKLMARGGVFLGGGIAPKILDHLRRPAFLEAFCDKGRMRPILERMPIVVVLAPDTALLGAAHYLSLNGSGASRGHERRPIAGSVGPAGLRPG